MFRSSKRHSNRISKKLLNQEYFIGSNPLDKMLFFI